MSLFHIKRSNQKFMGAVFVALILFGAAGILFACRNVPNARPGHISLNGNRCLGGTARVSLQPCQNQPDQSWILRGDGTIRSLNNCLDVQHSDTHAMAMVERSACRLSASQQWAINDHGQVINVRAGLCLDDMYDYNAAGNTIWLWPCNGSLAQQWHLPAHSQGSPKTVSLNRGQQPNTEFLTTAATGNSAAASPLANMPFYADPNSKAAAWVTANRTSNPSQAAAVSRLAAVPQAHWFGDSTPTSAIAAALNSYTAAAAASNKLPVVVAYAIPQRDCGSYSAGGFSTAAQYSAWIRQFAAGLHGRPVVVVLEPDALSSTSCLSSAAKAQRLATLKDAVDVLSTAPSTYLYVDAGNAHWLPTQEAARRLRSVDINRARGFSLNVSNFYYTAEQQAYGESISALLGGKQYVIDTSRNGNGPALHASKSWCNPGGRALGVPPSSVTSALHNDAYLWIKAPGESDGTCSIGQPAAGQWWASYALGLISASKF